MEKPRQWRKAPLGCIENSQRDICRARGSLTIGVPFKSSPGGITIEPDYLDAHLPEDSARLRFRLGLKALSDSLV